jgi:hypothetical protein
MLSAVAILIERTKTHPEEFANGYTGDYGKWDDVIKEFNACMTTEEREALEAALTNARREMFNEAVMKRLAGSDKKSDLLAEVSARSNRPKSILTSTQLTKDALKIIEGEFDKEYARFTKEYDINTDSYYLKEKK